MATDDRVYGAVMESAPLGIVVCRPDGTIVQANLRARAMLDPDAAPDPRPGRDGGSRGRVHDVPGLATPAFAEALEALAVGAPGDTRTLPAEGAGRIRLHRLEGDAIAIFLSGAPPTGHRTQPPIAPFPEDHFEGPLESLRRAYPFDSVVSFDEEFRYLAVDGPGRRELAVEPSDLIGRTFRDFWDEATVDRLVELAGVALRGFEAVQRIPYAGRVYQVWAGPLAPGPDGMRRGVFVSRDVTDEFGHQTRSQLLEKATDAAGMGLIIVDMQGEDEPIVHVSGGFERLTGYRRDEVLGRNCRFLQGAETDDLAVRGIREAIDAREPHQVTLLNYRQDGSSFWNRLTLTPFGPEGPEPTHYVGLQEDVTAIREEEMAREHHRRLAEVGTLAGSVAHDFNNLLMEVRGRVALCESSDEVAEIRSELERIGEAADRGSVLVKHLLAYARRGTRARTEGPETAQVRDVVPAVRRLIPRGVTIQVAHPDAPLPLPLNPVQLEQVLLNLAKNAADAMPDGGTIRIALEEGPEGDHVVLSFSDTGTGISPEVQERIFEPFFTTKGSGGTGLGLSSVANLVEHAGGSITVASEPGVGTTFALRLPKARESDEETPSPRKERRRPRGSLAGLGVLVAEDQEGVREVLVRLLEQHGLRVTAASDGAEAWRVYRDDPEAFDLVLADQDMPALGGARLIRRILAEGLGEHGPPWTAMMSGELPESPDLPEEVVTIQKPFDVDQLIQTLEAMVRDAPDSPGSPP